MQVDKLDHGLGQDIFVAKAARFLDGSGGQALQRRVLDSVDDLVDWLASKQGLKRLLFAIGPVQVSSALQESRHHASPVGWFAKGRHMERCVALR